MLTSVVDCPVRVFLMFLTGTRFAGASQLRIVFSVRCFGRRDVGLSIADAADSGLSVKVMSAKFLLCKVTIFPFLMNKYLGEDTLRL